MVSLDDDGVRCRVGSVPLLPGASSLWQVQQASGVPPEDVSRTLFHGTSWRHQDGVVYLTWAVGPDPDPDGEGVQVRISGQGVRKGRLDDPVGGGVVVKDVAEHAVAHISWLFRSDRMLFEEALEPELWQRIAEVSPVRAEMLP